MAYFRCVPLQRSIDDLPSQYMRCKYLESSGKQYIDTMYTPNLHSSLDATIKYTSVNEYASWNGWVATGSKGWFAVGCYGTETGLVAIFARGSRVGTATIQADTEWHNYFIKNGEQKIDDKAYSYFSYNVSPEFNTLYIFKGNNNYNAVVYAHERVKKWVISENGVVVQNFIPCIQKSDNNPCMYDTVSRKTYYNAGTGKFGYELMDGTYVAPI